jgi:hypothetical protein
MRLPLACEIPDNFINENRASYKPAYPLVIFGTITAYDMHRPATQRIHN